MRSATAAAQVAARAVERAAETQPWPGQISRRRIEFELLQWNYALPRLGRVLEIGCGNAIGSAFIASEAEMVVASDLPAESVRTHSIGLEAPRKLIEALGLANCRIVACSAEALPFHDSSFDLVFSLYVLEHLPEKERALAEIWRVLNPGGLSVAFVPNATERVYAPFAFYLYLAARAFARLRRPGRIQDGAPSSSNPRIARRRPFREAYPHFPLPEPHGAYADSFQEFRSHAPKRWRELFERTGFRIETRFYLMTVPINLFGPVLGSGLEGAYEWVAKLDRHLGATPLGPYLGQYACIVARRVD